MPLNFQNREQNNKQKIPFALSLIWIISKIFNLLFFNLWKLFLTFMELIEVKNYFYNLR